MSRLSRDRGDEGNDKNSKVVVWRSNRAFGSRKGLPLETGGRVNELGARNQAIGGREVLARENVRLARIIFSQGDERVSVVLRD